MKRILITGADGQLGRALNRILKENPQVQIINTDVDNLDIGNQDQVRQVVLEQKPEVIINCAAYTAVDDCESNQEKAEYINAIGPKNLALVAEEAGATLIHVSTDYVFSGKHDRPYVETDETNPQSVYGATKLAGEQYVQEYCSKFFIVRTAWLYGDGKNFVRTMLRLAEERDELTVVNDQFGSPTSALELARMIRFLMGTKEYGIYHGTCEGIATWYQFALEIFKLSGVDIQVTPVTSDQYKTPAKRPEYSVLENHKLNTQTSYRMKDWKEALTEYMKEEQNK